MNLLGCLYIIITFLQDSHHDQDRPFDFKRQMELCWIEEYGGFSLSLSPRTIHSLAISLFFAGQAVTFWLQTDTNLREKPNKVVTKRKQRT